MGGTIRKLEARDHKAWAMQAICQCCGTILVQSPIKEKGLLVATETPDCEDCFFDRPGGPCRIHTKDLAKEKKPEDAGLIVRPS